MNTKIYSIIAGVLVYLVTIASLSCTVYLRLNFAADGIENVAWEHIIGVFPILFLFAAIITLAASLVLILWKPTVAARLAFFASIAGWCYYAPMLCLLSLAYSPFFSFISILAFVEMLLPNLFLYLNLRYARWMMRQ